MIGNINSLRRQVKNVACNYSDAQVKVREATSNDPWGPSSSLMSEIADMTYNMMAFTEIMQIVWKRLNDHGKNWRHVYKSLVLLDYLIKIGSEKVAQQCRENIFAIQTLKDFQYIEENKDQGMNVREKAKQLVNLLKDDERLKNERARALMAKKRFAQNGVGIGSDGLVTREFRRSDTYHGEFDDRIVSSQDEDGTTRRGTARNGHRRGSEFEECRPSSIGEEELQLQIALALSKEEAQREDETRKGDDMRLNMAIAESRHDSVSSPNDSAAAAATAASGNGARAEQSRAIDDLLSLQSVFGGSGAAAAASANAGGSLDDTWASSGGASANNTDPWGAPVRNEVPTPQAHLQHQQQQQQQPAPAAVGAVAASDPWSPTNGNAGGGGGNASFDLPSSGDPFQTQPPLDWSSTGLNDPRDPFAPSSVLADNNLSFHTSVAPISQRSASADPWSMDGVKNSLPADSGFKTRNVKTPEHFLGENSALVNLDNLMGPMKTNNPTATATTTAVAGMPPKSAGNNMNNPFSGAGGGGSNNLGVGNNPFAAQQRPSPTLNEIRNVAGGGPASSTNAWNSQPSAASSTNPFL